MTENNSVVEQAIEEAPHLAKYIKEVAAKEPALIRVEPNVDPKTIPDAGKLQSFIDRIERLEEEKKELGRDINEIYSEAKGQGFDTKAIKHVIKLRKMMPADRQELEFCIDEYKKMIGMEG